MSTLKSFTPFIITLLTLLLPTHTLYGQKVESFTIFAPQDDEGQYNHGVVLFPFQGRLYAQWQSSASDEDAPDTRVLISCSSDGELWSSPTAIAISTQDTLRTSGGWWSDGSTLIAYINTWPSASPGGCKEGFVQYMISTDGTHWSKPDNDRLITSEGTPLQGIIEQDLRALPDGRLLTAFHVPPGLTALPYYTDDPQGIRGWTRGALEWNSAPKDKGTSNTQCTSRGIEPSWFLRPDSTIVMVFRDQWSSFHQLRSTSCDHGETWSTPIETDFPDSRAKQSAGNLPDGTPFIVNCPSGNKDRFPLVLSLSADGITFDHRILLRSTEDLPHSFHPGKYKRPGYSYPKSIIWRGSLWVAYATNKEVIQVTQVSLPLPDYD